MKKCAIGNGKSWDMSGQLKAIYRTEATGKSTTRRRENLGHAWATKSDRIDGQIDAGQVMGQL